VGDLDGQVAIVTGGARGIGFAIAEKLAARGASIAIFDVMPDEAEASARKIAECGVKALGLQVDVTDEESVDAAVKKAREEFGRMDILVNNAGITRDNILLRMKAEDWDKVLAVNLRGVFLCTKAVARYMCKARSGRIVNIASVVGMVGNAGQANYSASKAGVIGLTKTSAREFASRGVLVNAVAPGYIDTAMTKAISDEAKESALSQTPLGRLGLPEDVAAAVSFLCGPESAFITGHVVPVDGGMAI